MKTLKLHCLPVAIKTAITLFLAVLIIGNGLSGLLVTFSLHNSETSAIFTIDLIKAKYTEPPLKRAVLTSMRQYVSDEKELHQIVAWCDSGGHRTTYYQQVEPLIRKNCLHCHGTGITRANISLHNYSDLETLATGRGISVNKLLRQTHYHIYGIGLLVFFVSILFGLSSASEAMKKIVVWALFSFFIIDIFAWWLSKLSGIFAYCIIFFGGMLIPAMFIISLYCLYDMWLRKTK